MRAAEGFEEFVRVVDEGSVTAAARALDLPRPTVSRRLARLEERLGVRLLHRTTRRMNLTPAGERLYARARQLVDAAREVESEVRRLDGVPRGLLRISMPNGMPNAVIAKWMREFLERYPEVEIELFATGVHLDLLAEGIDVALRSGPIEDPSLIARTLVVNDTIVVASPDYLERRGAPTTAEALAEHDCILAYRLGKVPQRRWPLLDGGSVAVSGRLKTNQLQLRVEAARIGLGIALVLHPSAAEYIERGELVHVLPEIVGRRDRVNLVYVDREYLDPKVRAFIDFFAAQVAASRA